MNKLKMLVACEYSGIIRTAFEKKGWEAWSCDYLPTEQPGNHIQGDVTLLLENYWDLIIAHPPCTYLSYSGAGTLWSKIDRVINRIKAADFFMQCYNANAEYICVENPMGIMSKIFRAADQQIHPYYFGEREMKRTELWLKNLPKLKYSLTDNLFEQKTASEFPEASHVWKQKSTGKIKKNYFIGLKNKDQKNRSKSFQSIADAMAEQWTEYILNINNHE